MIFEDVEECKPVENEAEQKYHFFYNREERLAKAPQNVRDYYEGKMNPKKGLFRCLVSTPQNRFLFISILVFTAFMWMFSFFSGRSVLSFGNVQFNLTAFSYDEKVFTDVKISPRKKNDTSVLATPIPVKIEFQAIDSSGTVSDVHQEEAVFSGNEIIIKTKFNDYDIIEVKALVTFGLEYKETKCRVEKR